MDKQAYQNLRDRMEALKALLTDLYKPLICRYEIKPRELSVEDVEVGLVLHSTKPTGREIGFRVILKLTKEKATDAKLERYIKTFHQAIEKKLISEGVERIENNGK